MTSSPVGQRTPARRQVTDKDLITTRELGGQGRSVTSRAPKEPRFCVGHASLTSDFSLRQESLGIACPSAAQRHLASHSRVGNEDSFDYDVAAERR